MSSFSKYPKCIEIKFFEKKYIQGDFESCADILVTSYWLHGELGKNILKILCQKIKFNIK
jgi:hypothetical protein